MADTKISQMPSAVPLTGAESVPLVQGGINVQTPTSAIETLIVDNRMNVGAWQDFTNQTGSITTPTAITFDTTDIADGVTLVSNSRMTVPVDGVYNLQWSGQFQNSDNADGNITVWIRVDGVDVPGSAGLVSIPARRSVGNPGHTVASWNYFLNLTATQYVELYWLKSDSLLTLETYPASASPPYPSTASIIATVNQVR
jgi:hypothetical protein